MRIKDHNKVTVATYNNSFETYLSTTPNAVQWNIKLWIDTLLSTVSFDAKILEIWTWTWRDADYIESLWYKVQRSDFPDAFLEHNRKNWKEIIKLDIKNIELKEKYDVIFANGVLCHFTKQEVEEILSDLKSYLLEGWYFAFSLKKWVWEDFTDWCTVKLKSPRFYSHRNIDEARKMLEWLWFEILYIKDAQNECNDICIICR